MSLVRARYAGTSTQFGVKVVPGSSATAAAGAWNGLLKIRLAAPPEKGRANAALIEFLAGELGVHRRDIAIVSGKTNPVKQLQVAAVIPVERLDAVALHSAAGKAK